MQLDIIRDNFLIRKGNLKVTLKFKKTVATMKLYENKSKRHKMVLHASRCRQILMHIRYFHASGHSKKHLHLTKLVLPIFIHYPICYHIHVKEIIFQCLQIFQVLSNGVYNHKPTKFGI